MQQIAERLDASTAMAFKRTRAHADALRKLPDYETIAARTLAKAIQ